MQAKEPKTLPPRRRLRPGGDQDVEQADGGELGIVEKMIKVHRAWVMETMRAGLLAYLGQLAAEAGVIAVKFYYMSVLALASDVTTDRVGPRSHIARSPA